MHQLIPFHPKAVGGIGEAAAREETVLSKTGSFLSDVDDLISAEEADRAFANKLIGSGVLGDGVGLEVDTMQKAVD